MTQRIRITRLEGESTVTTFSEFLRENDGLEETEIDALHSAIVAGRAHSFGGGSAPLVMVEAA